jgi:hypothetical protein
VFNLIDEFTRECHCIHADRSIQAADVLQLLLEAISIQAADVLQLLLEAIERNGPPEYIRSDNGPVPRSEATTQRSAHSPLVSSRIGWPKPTSKQSTSTLVARGRTGMPRASTVVSVLCQGA